MIDNPDDPSDQVTHSEETQQKSKTSLSVSIIIKVLSLDFTSHL